MAFPTLLDAEIITEVRTLLGEPTARRITDAQLTRWIDKAALIICSRNLAYEAVSSITLIANTLGYTTITDCISVKSAIYVGTTTSGLSVSDSSVTVDTRALLKMHPRHFAHLHGDKDTTGSPQEYFFFVDTFYVWPLPNTANIVDVLYYKYPTTFTGANEFAELKAHMEQYVIWFVFAMALKLLGKMTQAYQYMSYFNNFLDFHKKTDLEFPIDSEDMMNLPDYTQFVQ